MNGLGGKLTPDPLYIQVRDLMARRIADGIWGASMRLPSEPQLAEEFGVSVRTIRRALEMLVNDSLVWRGNEGGMFVHASRVEPTKLG